MLTPETQSLWNQYLAAEKDGIRHVMLPALDRFIDALLASPRPDWVAWAKGVAAEVADLDRATPVRFPLFRRVLLPALADGVLACEPGCARWLASFDFLLVRCQDSGLPSHLRSTGGLLTEAIRLDPNDQRARRALVEHHAYYLDYSLHELPSGVLYGANGATLEECVELQLLLEEFREHVRLTGQDERFVELIEDCQLHYHAYAAYLQQPSPRSGYASYLEALENAEVDRSEG